MKNPISCIQVGESVFVATLNTVDGAVKRTGTEYPNCRLKINHNGIQVRNRLSDKIVQVIPIKECVNICNHERHNSASLAYRYMLQIDLLGMQIVISKIKMFGDGVNKNVEIIHVPYTPEKGIIVESEYLNIDGLGYPLALSSCIFNF